jgi:hypothetical protein
MMNKNVNYKRTEGKGYYENMEYFNCDSSEYTSSTLDLVRNAFRNDTYMNIFGRD